jgi:acetate kinase
MRRCLILTINGGSSSLKFALFAGADSPVRLLYGRVERIGMPDSRLVVADADCGPDVDSQVDAPDQTAAISLVMERLRHRVGLTNTAVVGQGIVHGGKRFCRFDPELTQVTESERSTHAPTLPQTAA